MEVVRLIGQEIKKCKRESTITLKVLRNYVLSSKDSDNLSIQGSVIWALSVVGNEDDVDFLIGFVKSEIQGDSEYAVYALTELNLDVARAKLRDSLSDIKRDSLKDYIIKSLKK